MSELWYSNPTQIYFACRALALGQTLNHMDVIRGVKGWRLSAIVETLRNRYGWPIETEYRGPERIGHYHLSKSCDPLRLAYPPSVRHLLQELEALGVARGKGGAGGVDG
ncbi:hypothetical protein PVW46_17310 [Mameliella sp. AT18]|uniref:hypothetical protein n=1 Tax=Mameliella sp. AT18 TaxID=3028385 RepID=UPI00084105EA|nr:hypothetical protein [Mameliella sp. AT18]MDD9731665.1 hypothetical protein [Mameliella sp. AT18]ODM45561.1 hypothetical protein A9320_27625 [Ruegeria sp. PBVC088]